MSELLFYDLKESAGVTPGLATQVCREIGRRIVAGNYSEGSLIADEVGLSQRFGVSKSVIREAVKMLVVKGMLEVKRGSGTRVRRRINWNLLDDDVLAWHQAVEPRPEFLRQLMDVRRLIEPKAAAWAAEFGTAEQVSSIRKAKNDMETAGTGQEFVMADALFHRAVLIAANNEILLAMEGVIFSALLSSIRLTNADPRKNTDTLVLHRRLLDKIESGKSDAAARAMEKHLSDTNARLEKVVPGFARAVIDKSGDR